MILSNNSEGRTIISLAIFWQVYINNLHLNEYISYTDLKVWSRSKQWNPIMALFYYCTCFTGKQPIWVPMEALIVPTNPVYPAHLLLDTPLVWLFDSADFVNHPWCPQYLIWRPSSIPILHLGFWWCNFWLESIVLHDWCLRVTRTFLMP